MPDIFNRTTDRFGGAFAADAATLTFPALTQNGVPVGADVGLLVQRMVMNYGQEVARLYEVGQPFIYYVAGRTQGTIGIDRVIGPRSVSAAFYQTYGDVCNAATNTMFFRIDSACNPEDINFGSTAYNCSFCVITNVGANVQARDMIINENLAIMFSSLNYITAEQQALAGVIPGLAP
jgi:hypothetical protein